MKARRSDNVEDERGSGIGRGAGIGIGTIVIVVIGYFWASVRRRC